jgi:hypothetical protein
MSKADPSRILSARDSPETSRTRENRTCTHMPLDVYERVRAQDDRFVVRPGHETPEIERTLDWTDDYVIVDKLDRFEPLVADDPRGAPSS